MVDELGGDRFTRSRLDPGGALADEVRRLRSELDVVKKMGRAARGIGALVYRSTTQSIATATDVRISFNTEVFDTGSFWLIGSPTRLTVPTDGTYLVLGQATFVANTTGIRLVSIWLNGSRVSRSSQEGGGTSIRKSLFTSKILQLSASDYLELNVHQTSGGNLNINAGDDLNYFEIWRLA